MGVSKALCKSCRRDIWWVKTVTGKSMPIDPRQVLGGNIRLSRGVEHDVGHTIGNPSPDHLGYVSHFTTCPNADTHRKKR